MAGLPPPPNPLASPTVLPHITTTRDWSPVGVLDSQFRDALNFNLSDDLVAVISSLLTALAIILLADLTFRLVVRASHTQVSSHAIHRYYLLSRATNPLAWISPSSWSISRSVSRSSSSESASDQKVASSPAAFPRRACLLVTAAGLLLIAAELLVIFLATSRTRPWPVDGTSLPTFRISDHAAHSPFVYARHQSYCREWPVTYRHGFTTIYSLNVCVAEIFRRARMVFTDERSVDILNVAVVLIRLYLHVDMRMGNVSASFIQHVRVGEGSGWDYAVVPNVSVADIRRALPHVLGARGIPLRAGLTKKLRKEKVQPAYAVEFSARLRGLRLASEDMKAGEMLHERKRLGRNATTEQVAWMLYVGEAVRSAFELKGKGKAFETQAMKREKFRWMKEEAVLTVYQRPRMSVGASLGLCIAIVAVWASVVSIVGWRGGVDHRQAWWRVLEGMEGASDLWIKPEQELVE